MKARIVDSDHVLPFNTSQFANFDSVVRSWYVVGKSNTVRRGSVRTFQMLGRRFALWRDDDGELHAADARCPHLGADLGQGKVIDGGLQCAFHHWRFNRTGRCISTAGHAASPSRCLTLYPIVEQYGLMWLFFGQHPTFPVPPLPRGEDERSYRRIVLKARHIHCHPHLVVGNGLDAAHFEALHAMAYTAPPTWQRVGSFSLSLRMCGRPRSAIVAFLTGTTARDIVASFTTVGPNIAWSTVESPVRFHCLFTGRPSDDKGCETRTVLFLPRRIGVSILRAVLLMGYLLHDDARILERLSFHPGFAAGDDPLRHFAELVEVMEAT